MLKNTSFLQRVLRREMQKILHTPKLLPPLSTRAHGYEYYSKTSKAGMVYCRKLIGHTEEEVLLDSKYLRMTNLSIRKVLLSPNHGIFAYQTEREGEEVGNLHFKDLSGAMNLKGDILEDIFNFVWANDNKTVYYTVTSDQLRPNKVYAHIIGTSQEEDILIYEDKDETTFVDISSTKDMKYITINANSLSSSEVRLIDALHDYSDGQLPSLQLVQGRKENLEYFVDHHDNQLYVLTNAGNAKNFKLVTAGQDKPDMQHWKDLITLSSTEKIEDVDLFKNRIVLYGRRDGLPMILCYDLKLGTKLEVDLPERFCIVHPGTNLDFDTDTFRFSVTSPYEHESTWEYNMDKKTLRSVRVHPIHKFDRKKYTCSQIHVESHDGAQVPVTLLHQKDLKLNGKNPVLMRSYGAYGITTDPDFRIENFSLLERGWVIALPHVRGGSELGRDWYENGKLLHKKNSFKDFIAVAEHLINKNLTSSKLLAAMGTSAGGLLVGAMVHMRPELFKAIVLRVPFVDPLSAMLNPDLPLTQVEYPEWGNPTDDKADYENIASYSPYENIIGTSANSYPSVLLTGGLKDQRVQVSQPLKYISRLRREIEHSNAVALCRIDTDRGHFGGGGEQEARLDEAAEELAFLISNVQK
ncbi:hypothetical protein INT44_004591 [Umbelopsis vinacea]|uniref:Prolyl endopeptidase n=1 Tax=Umbelopsis vinacea TaxID=44442 RepID=A0A8H7QAL9_9FUNG|nr:hypothetical protein INT44_004591 [Umbelopsis vinacea]